MDIYRKNTDFFIIDKKINTIKQKKNLYNKFFYPKTFYSNYLYDSPMFNRNSLSHASRRRELFTDTNDHQTRLPPFILILTIISIIIIVNSIH